MKTLNLLRYAALFLIAGAAVALWHFKIYVALALACLGFLLLLYVMHVLKNRNR